MSGEWFMIACTSSTRQLNSIRLTAPPEHFSVTWVLMCYTQVNTRADSDEEKVSERDFRAHIMLLTAE